MQAVKTVSEDLNVSREKLVALVGNMFGGASVGRDDDDHPLPPGPWDPIIRKVAKKVFGPSPEPWQLAFGPQPEPWRTEVNLGRLIVGAIAARHPEIYDVIGGGRFDFAALNPQPLPPRAAFLVAVTEEVIDRALIIQELADGLTRTGEEQGIIIVGGKLSAFVDGVDELCPRISRKFPKPKHGDGHRFSSMELLAAGAVFEQNAASVGNEGLQQELRTAGARLIEMGLERL